MSKLTAVLGIGALVLVWWLDHGAPSDARVAAALPAKSDPAVSPITPPVADPTSIALDEWNAGRERLPPVDTFTSMVDRPLFAPARRPIEQPVARAAEQADLEPSPWTVEPAAAPTRPSVDFVGSIEENGRVRALLGNGREVRGVTVGEAVEGWTVVAIEARRLTLGHDGEILELTILE